MGRKAGADGRAEWEMLAAKAERWLAGCKASPSSGDRWIDLAGRMVRG